MNTEVRLLKLTNGEDIIAMVDGSNPELYHLDNPLLMRIHSKITERGVQEGLHLSRWVQPFSESTNFTIKRHHVVLSTEVSLGLSKYYEYSVKSFERDDEKISLPAPSPTDMELEKILKEEEEEFMSLEGPSNKIH